MHVRRHAMKDLPTGDDGLDEVRTLSLTLCCSDTLVTLPREVFSHLKVHLCCTV